MEMDWCFNTSNLIALFHFLGLFAAFPPTFSWLYPWFLFSESVPSQICCLMIPNRPLFCREWLSKLSAKWPFVLQWCKKGPIWDSGHFMWGAQKPSPELLENSPHKETAKGWILGTKQGKTIFPKAFGHCSTELSGIPEISSPEFQPVQCKEALDSKTCQGEGSKQGALLRLSPETCLQVLEPTESPFFQQLCNITPIPEVLSWSWDIYGQKCACWCCTVMCLTYWTHPGVLLVHTPMLQGYVRKYSDPLGTSTPSLLTDPYISGLVLIPSNNPRETIILLTTETSTGKSTCCFIK